MIYDSKAAAKAVESVAIKATPQYSLGVPNQESGIKHSTKITNNIRNPSFSLKWGIKSFITMTSSSADISRKIVLVHIVNIFSIIIENILALRPNAYSIIPLYGVLVCSRVLLLDATWTIDLECIVPMYMFE